MFKRLLILLFCLIVVFVATFGFVVGVVAVPTIYSYADVVDDDSLWQPLNDNSELVTAFQSYCKSRDLTIEGSVADAVSTFTTGTFNGICNRLGINVTALQANIKKSVDNNGQIRFLFDSNGITAYNRIFAQFLQDNELEVGDENINETVYSGKYFVDADGNGCLVYVEPRNVSNTSALAFSYNCSFSEIGTDYRFSAQQLIDNVGNSSFAITFHLTQNLTYTQTLKNYTYSNSTYSDNSIYDGNSYGSGFCFYRHCVKLADNTDYYPVINGRYIVSQRGQDLYLSKVANNTQNALMSADNTTPLFYNEAKKITDPDSTDADVSIVSVQINNNNYEGDTIINNYGDVIEDDPEPEPGGNNPGWDIGGGEGSATDGNGNTWNITFPDFELPDLNIDWTINGLGEKFPFSIPFDLVALVTVLSAEPQAPRFEGTVNFGFTTWDYDINLEQFDTVASVCRIAELLLLIFGLILITRSIIKG